MKVSIVLVCLFLTACGGSSEEAPREATQQPTLFDPLTDTLDRASGVQDTLDDAAAERRRQLEEAER